MERKISVIENSNVKLLIYETAKENKNEVAVKFARNNETAHLLEMNFEEDNCIRGIYDITECVPIMESVSKYPGRDEVFNLIKRMLYVLIELRGSFICEPDLFLNKDYIYVDRSSDIIKYAITPEIQGRNNSVINLIEDIMVNTSWKSIENKSYLNVLENIIRKENVTYDEIIAVINMELEKPVQFHAVESVAGEKVQNIRNNVTVENVHLVEQIQPVKKEDYAEGSGMTGQLTQDNQTARAAQQAEPTPPVQQAVPTPPVQQAAPTPPVQQAAPMPPVQQAAPTPPVQQAAPISPGQQVPPMPLVQQTSQTTETQYSVSQQYDYDDNEGHFGETTVLGMSNQPMVFPAMIRIKTQEKIVINKSEFFIGKDPSRVDYCVFDNSAVSRVHAKIVCKNGEFFVVDNQSTNHVYVNGMLIDANVEVRLTHGARVRFGDEDFEFRFQ